MCNKAENELYRTRAQEKKKDKTLTEWLRNSVTMYVPYLPVYAANDGVIPINRLQPLPSSYFPFTSYTHHLILLMLLNIDKAS
jgi:hypothetical protein